MSGSFGIMLFMVRLLNVPCKLSSLPTKESLRKDKGDGNELGRHSKIQVSIISFVI